MENKRFFRRGIVCFGIILAIIIAAFCFYGGYIHYFNKTERISTDFKSNNDIELEIYPRGGDTDSWEKVITNEGESVSYKGIIYETELKNKTRFEISDWKLRVNISEDFCLNNAWCGTLEIHQMAEDGEKVQTLDLRSYEGVDITLNHMLDGPDLLIPLKEGDYFIYQPAVSADEYPIHPSDLEEKDINSVVVGMICYTQPEQNLEITDLKLYYHLKKDVTKETGFYILIGISVIWIFSVIVFLVIVVNMKATQKKILNDEKIIRQSISVFTRFFEAKDEYTKGHSQRVADYARLIGEQLGYSSDVCTHLYYIALMHDCGKIYIPDAILKKTGKLTDEEYDIIKTHTTKGAEMLCDFTSIEGIREGAFYHHERYDGKGYPTGKSGKDIPMIGRIICVADSFDAMNSHRCYRKKLPREVILSELESNKGKQFDPEIVDVFMELIKDGKILVGEK